MARPIYRPPTPAIDPALLSDIHLAAEDAYEDLASELRYDKDELHYRGLCVQTSNLIVQSLVDAGHPASVDQAIVHMPADSPDEPDFGYVDSCLWHHYTVISDDGRETVVDATWQQFLQSKQRSPSLPKVVVGDRSEVRKQIWSAGVKHKPTLRLWLPRVLREIDYLSH